MDIFTFNGSRVAANETLAQAIAELVHGVFQEPPWSFNWEKGNPDDKGGSLNCTARGFVNLLLHEDSDFVILGQSEQAVENHPKEALYGIAVGLQLCSQRIGEFSLEKVNAQPGDYYFATVALLPNYRKVQLQNGSAYRKMIQMRLEAAKQRQAPRVFARTIVGVETVQGLLPSMGFSSLGVFCVSQAGQESQREYFRYENS